MLHQLLTGSLDSYFVTRVYALTLFPTIFSTPGDNHIFIFTLSTSYIVIFTLSTVSELQPSLVYFFNSLTLILSPSYCKFYGPSFSESQNGSLTSRLNRSLAGSRESQNMTGIRHLWMLGTGQAKCFTRFISFISCNYRLPFTI